MQQRNHNWHRRESDICHAVGLFNIDNSFAHLLNKRKEAILLGEDKLLSSQPGAQMTLH